MIKNLPHIKKKQNKRKVQNLKGESHTKGTPMHVLFGISKIPKRLLARSEHSRITSLLNVPPSSCPLSFLRAVGFSYDGARAGIFLVMTESRLPCSLAVGVGGVDVKPDVCTHTLAYAILVTPD